MNNDLISFWAKLCESQDGRIVSERMDDFSPDRRISLQDLEPTDWQHIKAKNPIKAFVTKTDLFEDASDRLVQFYVLKYGYELPIWDPKTGKMYMFIPTTNDISRMFVNAWKQNKETKKLEKVTSVNKKIFVQSANAAKNIHTDTGNSLFKESEVKDGKISDFLMTIIQNSLNKCLNPEKYGKYENGHLNLKMERVRLLNSLNRDYGKIVAGYSDKSISKGKENQDMTMILTEKGIEFTISQNTNTLVSAEFKDCYGMGMFYGRCPHTEIPVSVIQACLENDRNGYSTLDTDSSRIG